MRCLFVKYTVYFISSKGVKAPSSKYVKKDLFCYKVCVSEFSRAFDQLESQGHKVIIQNHVKLRHSPALVFFLINFCSHWSFTEKYILNMPI